MSLRQALAKVPALRRSVMATLRLLERDILVKNQWTGDRLRINSYRHRTYWYYGRGRENANMALFARLVRMGDTVLEVGGHIGFITQYFSKLVGSDGKVIVFEPGTNNARYIEENIRPLANTTLVRAAASSKCGRATFFEDNVTGQNNSLLADFKGAESTAKWQGEKLERAPHEVEVVTIDSYASENGLVPDFLKIDAEGSELEILKGATNVLSHARALMVEISRSQESVIALLGEAGFRRVINGHGINFFAIRDDVSNDDLASAVERLQLSR